MTPAKESPEQRQQQPRRYTAVPPTWKHIGAVTDNIVQDLRLRSTLPFDSRPACTAGRINTIRKP